MVEPRGQEVSEEQSKVKACGSVDCAVVLGHVVLRLIASVDVVDATGGLDCIPECDRRADKEPSKSDAVSAFDFWNQDEIIRSDVGAVMG